ncbi:histidine kinase dimerization/phosphoacceptor domain -containing protein [Bradyrhizobium sp. McL0616]|uniref:histidine kinase dimerization/phosphoacceptor domain -containing protein n=1 Tax=Bradyrhizobium sp. McL0616 TaxID=3415674 RepID=UPI003CF09C7A
MSSLPEFVPGGGATAERLLLRELSHRIDDELTSVIDLVSKAGDRCDAAEARATLASVRGRLEDDARLYHALQMPGFATSIDLAAYLQQLCRSISRSQLEREGIALSLLLHPLKMSSERCWLLGMIVFELIDHAARQVSHDGRGAIRLEMWATTSSITCCVMDNGSCHASRLRGEDHSIVETLGARLGATVDVYAGSDGRRTIVNVPRWSGTSRDRSTSCGCNNIAASSKDDWKRISVRLPVS